MNYLPLAGRAAGPPRLAISVKEFCLLSGMGKSKALDTHPRWRTGRYACRASHSHFL